MDPDKAEGTNSYRDKLPKANLYLLSKVNVQQTNNSGCFGLLSALRIERQNASNEYRVCENSSLVKPIGTGQHLARIFPR